jgi:hypothetical protein
VPVLSLLAQDEKNQFCNKDVVLTPSLSGLYIEEGGFFHFAIPLEKWECGKGSVGGLQNVDRVDFQNTNIRDADICMDNIGIINNPNQLTR